MKLGLLITGHIPVELSGRYPEYPEMFRTLLQGLPEGTRIQDYLVWQNQFPSSTGECDAWIITGSQFNAWHSDPWIVQLGEFVRTCHRHKRIVLGICFGHQLIAHALGGRCETAPIGWGIGQRNVEITTLAPWMTPKADSLPLLFSHEDQVSLLPPGATLLAGTRFCPAEMYSLGEHIFCMQGHPEFTPSYARDLWQLREPLLGRDLSRKAQSSVSSDFSDEPVKTWILKFLNW